MIEREYIVADVFTDVPLQGNPVAVFTDGTGLSGELMQRTARELNLSETVFVLAAGGDDADATIRIFTPAVELPFAGHPTLGTAYVLGGARNLAGPIRLRTGSGVVPVALRRDGGRIVYGEMDQPVPTVQPFAGETELLAALGVTGSQLPVEVYDNGPRHVFVALADVASVSAVAPDMRSLAALGEIGVSCFAVEGSRVRSRMFGPGMGVAEDPATGSAAGPLAVHLARHGVIAFGEAIEIDQGVEMGRPSLLHAVAEGSPEAVTRVGVGGATVVVGSGRYRLE